ncbi:hypothetical protein PPERSA_01556 [Pseudocohnilembus persalinus]|uniref:START domain-containing protein n=1 Tax=Pseudocohnilembus persalinus TaxID=266149 RepID=A0A0V0QHN0_PSEPJ|nr:hypothetical protein PPERSA_01556 [Pseudocohnilembus persalinus]|eukprot:KRX01686.1 hypothetical protein PPERSA_01556 [Pseudocohnilembus persalinus]
MIQSHDQSLEATYKHVKNILELPQSSFKSSDKFKSLGTESFKYEDPKYTSSPAFKAEGIINASLQKIRKEQFEISPEENMRRNKNVKVSKLIKVTEKGYSIMFEEQSVPIISDRQVLFIVGNFEETENGVLIVGTSIEDESLAPSVKGKVRAINNYSAFKLEKISENQTKITILFQIDPAGSVPGFVKGKLGNKRVEELFTQYKKLE